MAKKIFMMMLLAVSIMLVGIQNPAEAREQYVGNYSDGSAVYLLTQSVNIESYSPYTFSCSIRVGRDYIDYLFFPRNGSPYYRNSEGYEGFVNEASPVAAAIYRYVVNNW